jgi:hypothetical protein
MKHGIIIALIVAFAFVMGFFVGVRILEYATGETIEYRVVSNCVSKFEKGCMQQSEILND